jgi:hypothetical protein
MGQRLKESREIIIIGYRWIAYCRIMTGDWGQYFGGA